VPLATPTKSASGKKGMESNNIYTEAFHKYKKMGLDPVPIPKEVGHPSKGPTIPDWPTKAANGGFSGRFHRRL
jgi:hypothetical protein